MGKKKSTGKVPRITEKQYGEYIMSLKDERPTKVIIPKEDKE